MQLHQLGAGLVTAGASMRRFVLADDCIFSNVWRIKRQTKKNPTIADRVFLKEKQPGAVSPNNKPDDNLLSHWL
ncbi:hypothetical protein, partial [Janthinobacterium sp. PSPC1-1]|uniref:hypothetical protein n=1 Tax=Janthinobacterium sp. PSPC1-1 TaxID=2804581 RepID=UPI003CE7027C